MVYRMPPTGGQQRKNLKMTIRIVDPRNPKMLLVIEAVQPPPLESPPMGPWTGQSLRKNLSKSLLLQPIGGPSPLKPQGNRPQQPTPNR